MLKWTMESILAAIAVAVSMAGGVYTTVYHNGTVNQQIVELQAKNAQTEVHVAKHDDSALSNIQQQNAAIEAVSRWTTSKTPSTIFSIR